MMGAFYLQITTNQKLSNFPSWLPFDSLLVSRFSQKAMFQSYGESCEVSRPTVEAAAQAFSQKGHQSLCLAEGPVEVRAGILSVFLQGL